MFAISDSFDREQFLSEYWQKKPLLIRGLFKDFKDPLSAEELAGLACESLVESRLIEGNVTLGTKDAGITETTETIESPAITAKLSLTHGPIDESYFPTLPEHDWTVLVQAVDQWVPEVAQLRDCFNFLPSWRIEDVMISFAAPGGTVGPHFDYYDVFLLQGSGSRHWRLGERCTGETRCSNQAGLSLLPEFETLEDFDLQAGDVLYLPPRYAHWGTATDAGLCYSIGLRSPSLAEMLEGFSDALIARSSPMLRFEDPAPAIPDHPAEIRPATLDRAFASILDSVSNRDAFNRWFGCQVTQPRYPEHVTGPDQDYSLAALQASLDRGATLLRHPASRFAKMTPGNNVQLCFVDGACFELSDDEGDFVAKLTDQSFDDLNTLFLQQQSGAACDLVLKLVNQGSLTLEAP